MAFALAFSISAVTFALPFLNSGMQYSVSADGNAVHISSRWGQLGSPDIAKSQFGDTVLVWQDKGGQTFEIYTQSFDSSGNPFGYTKKINRYRPNDQKNPRIAMDEVGNYTVVWQSYGQDGSESGIYGQRFSYEGVKIGSEFKINTYILGNQANPAIAMSKTGWFVVSWVSDGHDKTGIFAQIFSASGEKIGNELGVNTYKTDVQENPAVAVDESGNIMIVWQSKDGAETANGWDIHGRLFKSDGTATTEEDFVINKTRQYNQQQPDVISIGGGKFMVAWNNTKKHETLENLVENVKGQIVSNAGKNIGNEFNVSEAVFGHQENPKLAVTSSSKIIAVWEHYDKFLHNERCWHIFSQFLNTSGGAIGEEMMLDPTPDNWNREPAIASDTNGNTDVIWTGLNGVKYKKALHYLRNINN